jgi:hypothetical protein
LAPTNGIASIFGPMKAQGLIDSLKFEYSIFAKPMYIKFGAVSNYNYEWIGTLNNKPRAWEIPLIGITIKSKYQALNTSAMFSTARPMITLPAQLFTEYADSLEKYYSNCSYYSNYVYACIIHDENDTKGFTDITFKFNKKSYTVKADKMYSITKSNNIFYAISIVQLWNDNRVILGLPYFESVNATAFDIDNNQIGLMG